MGIAFFLDFQLWSSKDYKIVIFQTYKKNNDSNEYKL